MITQFYSQTPDILKLSASIYEKLGEIKARYPVVVHTNPQKAERVETICATMKLEGHSLSRDKVLALLKNNLVRGPQELIQETKSVLDLYRYIRKIDPWNQNFLKKAHSKLSSKLIDHPGKYRTNVSAIFRGTEIIRMAPPPEDVSEIMSALFQYLNQGKDPILIKGCMAHYLIESTAPFESGSGKMGRLWQTVLLMQEHNVFEFLPFDRFLYQNRKEYFKTLTTSNEEKDAASFIIFILYMIDVALTEYMNNIPRTVKDSDRILNFYKLGMKSFTRKDYMGIFKNISSATASRDLEKGVSAGLFEKKGTKNTSVYSCRRP